MLALARWVWAFVKTPTPLVELSASFQLHPPPPPPPPPPSPLTVLPYTTHHGQSSLSLLVAFERLLIDALLLFLQQGFMDVGAQFLIPSQILSDADPLARLSSCLFRSSPRRATRPTPTPRRTPTARASRTTIAVSPLFCSRGVAADHLPSDVDSPYFSSLLIFRVRCHWWSSVQPAFGRQLVRRLEQWLRCPAGWRTSRG